MRHFCVIPARAGSKSIINKNLQKLGNRRLVDWTIDYAKKSKIFSQILITTDIPILLEEEKDICLERKAELCTDGAVMSDVLNDAMDNLDGLHDSDYVWLLQPTSPFRRHQDIESLCELIRVHAPKSLVSVKDVGSNHPQRMYTVKNSKLYPIRYTSFVNKQDLPAIYIRNGCFYIVQVGAFKANKTFYIKPCVPYVMEEARSINIDSVMDLVLAQSMSENLR